MTARGGEVIEDVTAAVYEIPTGQPEADGTLAWSSTTLVTARVTGGGRTGTGYTYAHRACQPLITGPLAAAVTGTGVLDTGRAAEAMIRAVRNLGRPGLASCAISAVDTALWDLKATVVGLPVFRLLGAATDQVPAYGSGGFTTYDAGTAGEQLRRWTGELGLPRVKIKIGESWGTRPDRDLERVAFARKTIGPAPELYVDANGGYGRKQAVRMGRAMRDWDVTWFEEPVSSDDLDGLREVRDQVPADVAAGEYGYDLPYFARMVDAGAVDCLQVDVTRCGGVTEWLRAAAVAAARGLPVSAHCAPALHAHVAAAAANTRHVEYFHDHERIENMLFDGAPRPRGGALRPDPSRPGFGLELRDSVADQFRVA
ncbi:MAG: mandelate racemase [Nocardiopsaceae bacterium]|nr:mandelate racemase [Nocardiopsaceae bacterium]